MIFLALVTFEHGGDDGDHLPLDCQGACGWMTIEANDEDDARSRMAASLAADRLKLVQIERVHEVRGAEQAESLDDHLAANMREWEIGRPTVWGTIHCYVGDRSN